MSLRRHSIGLLILGLLLFPFQASAQTPALAALSVLNADAFPHITAYLDVHDVQGYFVHNLEVEQVQVFEDNNPVTSLALKELQPGAQIVIALNPGLSFGIRNNQGVSRYDLIKEHLANWAISRRGSSIDDWSLLITDGPGISHVTDPLVWLEALQADQTNARTASPSMDTLLRAINLAADPSTRPGMGRAVLFITPSPEGLQSQTLENITAQAHQQNVVIFVWLVSSAGAFPTTGVEQLRKLVIATRGQFYAYTGAEVLPNPEEYIEPLRSIYQLSYQSASINSGIHQVVATIQDPNGSIETEPQVYSLEIQPPLPAFIAPPIQIQRKVVTEGKQAADENDSLPLYTPTEHVLQIVVDYPDGRLRPLEYSALVVDGSVVAENLEPPFDQFTWNIDGYVIDGIHTIQVQVRDTFGLAGASVEIPVQISIELVEPNPWNIIQRNLATLTVLAVVLAGAVLLLVLITGGKLSPRAIREARRSKHKLDPVTQPIQLNEEENKRQAPSRSLRLHWPQRSAAPQAYAFLTPISDAEYQPNTPPIPITSSETVLGSNPNQATITLNDPSIEASHARLVRTTSGNFRLTDQGTTAGTWINYSPTSRGGTILEHGDIIHIGKVGFRFTMRNPTRVRKPVISLAQQTEEAQEEDNT